MTQRVAAERMGISPNRLSKYERGLVFPSLNMAHDICVFYDAPMDFLLTGRGLNRVLKTKTGTMAQRQY